MPYTAQWHERKASVLCWGQLTPGEFLGVTYKICEDYRFDTLKFIVYDFLGIEGHALNNFETMEAFAANAIGAMVSNPKLEFVFVATDPEILAMAEALRSSHYLGGKGPLVFSSRHGAAEWTKTRNANRNAACRPWAQAT